MKIALWNSTFRTSWIIAVILMMVFNFNASGNSIPTEVLVTKGEISSSITDIYSYEEVTATASHDGIHLLQGSKVRHIHANNSALNGNVVTGVFISSNNILYATSSDSGVFVYDILTDENYLLELHTSISSKCNGLSNFEEILYFLCGDKIITFDLTNAELKYTQVANVEKISFTEIFVINSNDVLLGSFSNGLFKYSRDDNKLESLIPFKDIQIYSIDRFSPDQFVVGSSKGAIIFKESLEIDRIIKPSSLDGISIDHVVSTFQNTSEELWLGTFSDGIIAFDHSTEELRKKNFKGVGKSHFNDVRAMAKTQNSEIFIASNLGGILVVPAASEFTHFFDSSEAFSDIWAVKNIDSSTLVLTDNGVFQESSGVIVPLTTGIGYTVDADIFGDELYYVTVENGIVKVDQSGRHWSKVEQWDGFPFYANTELSNFAINKVGAILVGTYGGESRGLFYGSESQPFRKIYDTNWITNIEIIEDGSFLVLTYDGSVLKVDTNGNLVKQSNSESAIVSMCQEQFSNDSFLICTRQNGVWIFSDNKLETYHYSASQGVVQIRDILNTGDGVVWLSTGDGLKALYLEDKSVFSFTKHDGVDSTDFSENASIKMNEREALFAGNKGLFKIDFVKAKEYMDKVRSRETSVTAIEVSSQTEMGDKLEKLKRFNWSESSSTKSLELTHDSVIVEFDMQHNNFEDRHHIGFEVRMMGLNSNWRRLPKDRDTVTYTTLPAGNYVFQSRAVDPRSMVEQPVSMIHLTVLPPWWKTWKAYTGYALLLIFLAYLLYLYRTKTIRKQNLFLEHTVEDRTATIQGLMDQQQHFFANVSHEFRTPLTLILGPLESIYKKTNDNDIRAELNVVSRNAKRLNGMVDQILELTRLENAKTIERQIYDAQSTIKLIASSFESLAANKKQKLQVENEVEAKLDLISDSLERIIGNLISNAVKYCPPGSTITVRTEKILKTFRITVSDNGPGIPDEHKKRVFERFARLDAGEHIQGAGIGLALVNELVSGNKGSINLETSEQSGSCFIVELPIAINQNASTKVMESTDQLYEVSPSPSEIGLPLSTVKESKVHSKELKTMLIVEDNKDLRDYIASNFAGEFNVVVAKNGEFGFKKAIDNIPDIIITDVLMPAKNGFELSRALRQEQSTSHVPIILLTAKEDEESRMYGWKEGVDDFIAKPFNMEELRLRVTRLLTIRKILKARFSEEVSNNLATKNSNPISFQSKRDMEFFQKFVHVIEQRFDDEQFNRTIAAKELAMSERQLNRKLSALVDFNFAEYLRKFRIQKAKEALLQGQQITQVAYDVGFTSASYFTSCFKAEVGMTPKQFVESEERRSDVIALEV